MKKIIGSILLLCVWAFAASAQTPEEIVARMEAELSKYDVNDGVEMTVDINSGTNKVEIEKAKESLTSDGDLELFDGITDGYDVSLKKEDANAWYLQCKKNKALFLEQLLDQVPDGQKDHGTDDGADNLAIPL